MSMIQGRNQMMPNYPAAYMPTVTGYTMPGYSWPGTQQQYQPMQQMTTGPGMPAAQPAGPQMTLPTVHADILQIPDEEAGEKQPVDAGTSQMMITKDESAIMIKSVLANGEAVIDLYRRQPRAEKPTEPEYITRAEFEKRIAEVIRRERARETTRDAEAEESAEEPEREEQTEERPKAGGTRKR